mgnify:CR=1 FL=1
MAQHRNHGTRSREVTAPAIVALLVIALFDMTPLFSSSSSQSAAVLTALQQRITKVPLVFSGWQGRPEELSLASSQPGVAHAGYLFRRDDNQETVRVCLLAGPWRSLANHEPGELFPGSGFRAERPPTVYETDAATWRGPLATTTFVKEDPQSAQPYRIWWSYAGGDGWALSGWLGGFAASQPVVKVYLIQEGSTPQALATNPAAELGGLLLPAWAAVLFPNQEAAPPAHPEQQPAP